MNAFIILSKLNQKSLWVGYVVQADTAEIATELFLASATFSGKPERLGDPAPLSAKTIADYGVIEGEIRLV